MLKEHIVLCSCLLKLKKKKIRWSFASVRNCLKFGWKMGNFTKSDPSAAIELQKWFCDRQNRFPHRLRNRKIYFNLNLLGITVSTYIYLVESLLSASRFLSLSLSLARLFFFLSLSLPPLLFHCRPLPLPLTFKSAPAVLATQHNVQSIWLCANSNNVETPLCLVVVLWGK